MFSSPAFSSLSPTTCLPSVIHLLRCHTGICWSCPVMLHSVNFKMLSHYSLPIACSGSVSPQLLLQPCDLISLTVPGESLRLSLFLRSPFLLRFTLSVTNSLWHLSKCSALCWMALCGLFTHCIRTKTQSPHTPRSTRPHTQVHAKTGIHTKCGHGNVRCTGVPPGVHTLRLTPLSPAPDSLLAPP